MLDGNVLLRQKRDEVPEGTLSCPDRNLAVFHHYRHYEGLRLLPSVCDSKLIQQTLSRCSKLVYTIHAGVIQFNIALSHSFAPTAVFHQSRSPLRSFFKTAVGTK